MVTIQYNMTTILYCIVQYSTYCTILSPILKGIELQMYCGRAGPHRPQLPLNASNQPLQFKKKVRLFVCLLFIYTSGLGGALHLNVHLNYT